MICNLKPIRYILRITLFHFLYPPRLNIFFRIIGLFGIVILQLIFLFLDLTFITLLKLLYSSLINPQIKFVLLAVRIFLLFLGVFSGALLARTASAAAKIEFWLSWVLLAELDALFRLGDFHFVRKGVYNVHEIWPILSFEDFAVVFWWGPGFNVYNGCVFRDFSNFLR